ncbi:MAG: histidine kinase dimerization/phospho-acceptor domain-containing protein, partial [Actinomycetota bacterium]|nr:histidine kinase dimerization/phospho-acceptor domain-containing protein [Actinomycetota bacterium]
SLNQIFELSMLTTDYLVHYEPRAERQWRAMHAELEHVLNGLALVSGADEPLLDHVRENSAEAYLLFDEITVAHEQGALGEVDPVISREYQSRLAARLLVVMQSMVSDSVTLGERSSLDAITTQQRTFALVLAIALSGVSVMVFIGVSTNRTIVTPIRALRDSAQEVGRGRLSTRSGIRSSDEVGELATAFDGMVAELQQSHTMLEREVTDRRRAERELSEYRDHLEQLVEARTAELLALNDNLRQATRAKDDFMASMSHELRTPLNSIIGFTDIMLKRMAGDLTDEQERQLTMVLHSGQQLLSLIDDVLDLARLEAGRARIDVTSFPVAEAIGMLMDMMSPIAAGQRVAL